MNTQTTAELLTVRNETRKVEIEIEDLFRDFTKKSDVDMLGVSDYCSRRFPLIVFFDLVNIDSLEKNIDNLKKLIERYKDLRKKQSGLEKEVDIHNSVTQQIQNGIDRLI